MLMSPDDEQMAMDENSFQTKNQLLVTEEELAVTEDQEQMSTDVVLPSTHDRVISASEVEYSHKEHIIMSAEANLPNPDNVYKEEDRTTSPDKEVTETDHLSCTKEITSGDFPARLKLSLLKRAMKIKPHIKA